MLSPEATEPTERKGEGEERSDDRSQGWHGQVNEQEDR
jgi:hypothetical protein